MSKLTVAAEPPELPLNSTGAAAVCMVTTTESAEALFKKMDLMATGVVAGGAASIGRTAAVRAPAGRFAPRMRGAKDVEDRTLRSESARALGFESRTGAADPKHRESGVRERWSRLVTAASFQRGASEAMRTATEDEMRTALRQASAIAAVGGQRSLRQTLGLAHQI